MKAVVYYKYGGPEVLEIAEVNKPKPRRKQILVRVVSTSVMLGDCELRRPDIPNGIWFIVRIFFGLFKPRNKILGNYYSGIVEELGNDVSTFEVGDEVYACAGWFKAHAEYVVENAEGAIIKKPQKLSFDEAAPLGIALDPLHYLRKANIKKGEKVLINGGGGSMGIFAIQFARIFGAEVTAVDTADKHKMMKQLGAKHVVDYTKEKFFKQNKRYDAIFDIKCELTFWSSLRVLKSGGRYLMVNPGGILQILEGLFVTWFTRKKVISKFSSYKAEDLAYINELIENGELISIIDKEFKFEEVADAHRYIEGGKKKGNIVLMLN